MRKTIFAREFQIDQMLIAGNNMHKLNVMAKGRPMRSEWLEDILAVLETGSFTEAADRRFLTQSAFSRRIRMIEDHIGAELFDRSRKPVQLSAATAAEEDRIRMLTAEMRALVHDLRRSQSRADRRIALGAQHSIVTALAPRFVTHLVDTGGLNVRLRGGNRDECYSMLLNHGADLVVTYAAAGDLPPGKPEFFQTEHLGFDRLVPLAAPLLTLPDSGPLPVIGYPKDVHLGRVFEREIAPAIGSATELEPRVETALTMSALELAKSGVGVAWLPETLARPAVADGALCAVPHLPPCRLSISATRLVGNHTKTEERAWTLLCSSSLTG